MAARASRRRPQAFALDGAMTEILISLVAVVLLILVIGFFAMRFLRADEHEDTADQPARQRAPRQRGPGAAAPAASREPARPGPSSPPRSWTVAAAGP